MIEPAITALDPAGYQRFPWKNGGGVTTDIAAAYRPGAAADDWDGMLWRFGFTPIAEPGPFSGLPHIDRCQVVVEGRGLVLETPRGYVDLREPLAPRRFAGETPIRSRLEAGPVTVVNLLADRRAYDIDLIVLRDGQSYPLTSGRHIAYACIGDTVLAIMQQHAVRHGHALQIDLREVTVVSASGAPVVLASIKAH